MSQTDSATISEAFARQRARLAERRRTFGLGPRRAALQALYDALGRHEAAILAALAADFGKPAPETLLTELLPLRQDIKLALRRLPRWMRDRRVGPTLASLGSRARIRREARGVCLIIAPWNYPLNLALSPLVSCLAAGNSAIVKPSELTPATSAVIATIVAECFTPDLVTVIEGDATVATALLALPFDHIFFTGSPEVGRVVMAAAARHLSSVTLELGGKSPVILGEGADLDRAADWIVFGKFINAGQTCIAPDHVHVHESLLVPLRAALQERILRGFGMGQPIARIITPRHADRLRHLLQEAAAAGAHVPAGAEGSGTSLPPVLIEGITPDMRIAQEEIFGPILPLVPYRDPEEVLARITAGPKPLALYVFDTRDDFIARMINETSSGGVAVNATLLQFSHNGLPFGGVNTSGLGQAHGEWGFRSFSHERAVLRTRFSAVTWLFPPYSAAKRRLLQRVMRVLG